VDAAARTPEADVADVAASAASAGGIADTAGPDFKVHAVLCSVQIFFGIFHVVAKAVLAEMDPLALAGLRVLGAAPLLLAVAWHYDRVRPRLRDLPALALLGALGVFANQVLFILGLARTTATNAAILMVSVPVLAVGVAALLRIERLGPRRLLGVALAVAGALVLLDPGRLHLGPGVALGNALILTNGLCYATFLVLQRPLLARPGRGLQHPPAAGRLPPRREPPGRALRRSPGRGLRPHPRRAGPGERAAPKRQRAIRRSPVPQTVLKVGSRKPPRPPSACGPAAGSRSLPG